MKTLHELAKQAELDCAPDGNIYSPDVNDVTPLNVYLERIIKLVREEAREELVISNEKKWENRAKELFDEKIQSEFTHQGNLNTGWFYRLKRFFSDLFN